MKRDPLIDGTLYLLLSAAVSVVAVAFAAAAGCALEPDYDDPEPFCSQALECWEEADGDPQREAECKWDWPNDWQCAAGQVTCDEMLEECNVHE